MKRKVGFEDLSIGLKTAIVLTWIMAGLDAMYLIAGFISGIIG